MDKFLHDFIEALPVFLCVADVQTKAPIYYNKIAAEILRRLPYDRKVSFVEEVVRMDSTMKFCERAETGRGRWFQMETNAFEWLDGRNCILIVGTDCSKTVTNEELLTIAAYTDSLTGIYNRKIGTEMLGRFVNEIKVATQSFSVCFLDIDDLKYVNDNFGHGAGDKYILTVTDLVKQSIRKTDIFARMGGDEFLIIFPKCPARVVASIMGEVYRMLEGVNENNEPKTNFSISYGILEVPPGDGRNMEEILSDAGTEMYRMKGEYKKTRVLPEVRVM